LIREAQLGGEVLALKTNQIENADNRLHLIRVSDGVPLGEHQLGAKNFSFRLSANGALLARQIGDATIEVSRLAGGLTKIGRTQAGGFPYVLPFVLGRDRLLLHPGKHAFLLDWSSGKLKFGHYALGDDPKIRPAIDATAEALPEPCRYDTKRWLL